MTTYRIKPLPLLKFELDMGSFYYRTLYGNKMIAPVFMWHLEGGDMNILVDTGAEAKTAKELRGFDAEEVNTFEGALAGVGLKPEDIDLVIQTHLHWDHCGNTAKCPKARVVVQAAEIAFALSPHVLMANLYHRPFFSGLNFKIVDGRYEVAPGIEVIPAPGHTPGVQAVGVNTTSGRAVISGFCCTRLNFEPPEEVRSSWPVLAAGTHTDALQAFDSVLKIKGLADIIIPQHEPSLLEVESIP